MNPLNALHWNGLPGGELSTSEFVAYELNRLKREGDTVEAIPLDSPVVLDEGLPEYGIYGRLPNGEAVSIHDTFSLSEAQARLLALNIQLHSTPSSQWKVAGEVDPHDKRYDCPRSELPLGRLTDDELANALFMHDHRSLNLEAIMAGQPSSIGLLTAARDRIRWLSRKVGPDA